MVRLNRITLLIKMNNKSIIILKFNKWRKNLLVERNLLIFRTHYQLKLKSQNRKKMKENGKIMMEKIIINVKITIIKIKKLIKLILLLLLIRQQVRSKEWKNRKMMKENGRIIKENAKLMTNKKNRISLKFLLAILWSINRLLNHNLTY